MILFVELLEKYRNGTLIPYIDPRAREERGIAQLTEFERDVAEQLLGSSNIPDTISTLERRLPPKELLAILRTVLRPAIPPLQGSWQVRPYVAATSRNLRLLLEEVDVGITGILTRYTVLIEEREEYTARASPLERIRLLGARPAALSSDDGTEYRWVGASSRPFGPARVSVNGKSTYRWGLRVEDGWLPGVPDGARQLTLRFPEVIEIVFVNGKQVIERYPVEPITVELELPERES